MYEILAKVVFIEGFKIGIQKLWTKFSKKDINLEKINKLAEALEAIQNASIKTKAHISKKGYKSNTDLSLLWNKAVKQSINAGMEDIPKMLTHKAKFWGSPQDWLKEKNAMKLVPTLDFLADQSEMLLIDISKLQKKSK